jgi:hypothetical protein
VEPEPYNLMQLYGSGSDSSGSDLDVKHVAIFSILLYSFLLFSIYTLHFTAISLLKRQRKKGALITGPTTITISTIEYIVYSLYEVYQ